jgi:hypothetical protein
MAARRRNPARGAPTRPDRGRGDPHQGGGASPLIASARVNGFAGGTPGVYFLSEDGFESVIRSSPGVYTLTLEDPPDDPKQTVVTATSMGAAAGVINVSVLSNGKIQLTHYDLSGARKDAQLSIAVFAASLKE